MKISRSWTFLLLLLGLLTGAAGAFAEVTASPEVVAALQAYRELLARNPAEAKAFLEQKLKAQPAAPLFYEAALAKAAAQDYAAAAELFAQVLRLDSKFPGARRNRGQLLAALGQHEAAAPELLLAMDQEGPDGPTMLALGQCYQALGKGAAAETALRWALLHQPDSADVHLALAATLLAQDRLPEAETAAAQALRLGSKDPNAWLIRANACIGQGKAAEAIDVLEAAQLLEPAGPAELAWTLGSLYLNQRMTREAAAVLRQAHERQPGDVRRLGEAVDALLALGDGAAAAPLVELLVKAQPNAARTWQRAARVAELAGRQDDAIQQLAKATTLDPACGPAFLDLGRLLTLAGRYPQALDALRTARAFPGQEVSALRLELDLWLRQRQWTEASAILVLLAQKDPRAEWTELQVRLAALRQLTTPAP